MDAEDLYYELENMGLEPWNYSGRGMYGKECVAVMVRHPGDFTLPKGWDWDGMGREIVVYWPRMAWPFPEQDEEDAA